MSADPNTRRGSGPIAPSGFTIDTETPSCVIGDRTGTISGIADLRTGNKTPPKFGGVLTLGSAVRRAD